MLRGRFSLARVDTNRMRQVSLILGTRTRDNAYKAAYNPAYNRLVDGALLLVYLKRPRKTRDNLYNHLHNTSTMAWISRLRHAAPRMGKRACGEGKRGGAYQAILDAELLQVSEIGLWFFF